MDTLTVGVTGAGGKTGRAVLHALHAAGHRTRALVRGGAASGLVRAAGAEPVVGDMTEARDLARLLAGCGALYHIPPNMSRDEQRLADAVVAGCRAAGTRRVVYHSVLHPQTGAMPHHWEKLRVEERLLETELETVFCQPAPYMQNFLPYVVTARETGTVAFPYGPDVVLTMVDLADVGAAAAQVVAGAEHVGASYQLCADDVRTQGEAWDVLADAFGLDVPFASIGHREWRRRMADRLDATTRDWLAAMFAYYDQHGLRGSSLPLRALLGRVPRGLGTFAAEAARETSGEEPR